MLSLYGGDLIVVSDDKTLGNLLASLFAAEPGDANTFDKAANLRPIGDTGSAVKWGVPVTVKQNVINAANEYNSEGPYTILNLAGLTNEDIAMFKEHIVIIVKPVGYGRLDWITEMTNLGLEQIPST